MHTVPLAKYFDIVFTVATVRFKILRRYPSSLLIEMILPIIATTLPLLLGSTLGGRSSGSIFVQNTGTLQYKAYLLIGSTLLVLVSSVLRTIALWLYLERSTGTLESMYFAPVSRFWILLGVALHSIVRSCLTLSVSFLVGCVLFDINPFGGNILLSLPFFLSGILAVSGISLFFGALVLRFKEANALLQIAQWVIILFMGVYFPIQLFPSFFKWLSLAFPPTWMNNDIRAAFLGTRWISGVWYGDLLVLCAFALVIPVAGYGVFRAVERSLQMREGLGQM